MPHGKPAGVRCVQLSPDNHCLLFGHPTRPRVCVDLHPSSEMCGTSGAHAIEYLTVLETLSAPDSFQK